MDQRTTALAVGIGILSLAPAWARDAADIRKQYQQIKTAQTGNWWTLEFALAAEWAIQYLNTHPGATERALADRMDNLDSTPGRQVFSSDNVRLAPQTWVLSASYCYLDSGVPEGRTFMFFVLAGAKGQRPGPAIRGSTCSARAKWERVIWDRTA